MRVEVKDFLNNQQQLLMFHVIQLRQLGRQIIVLGFIVQNHLHLK